MSQIPSGNSCNDRKATEARLAEELKRAREQYDICTERYKQTVAKPKAALPDPMITAAIKAQLDAAERYRRALERFNEFLLNVEFP